MTKNRSSNDSPDDAHRDGAGRLNDLRFADFLQEIVACFDPQLRHTYVNSAVELFTGRPATDFIGKTNRELGMPDGLVDQWDAALGDVFRTGQPGMVQFSFETPSGIQTFRSHLAPQVDAKGSVANVISVAQAFGGPPLPGNELEHFKALVESSDDAIIGKTLEGVVTSWNRGAEEIFGYTGEEMIGQSLLRLFPADRQNEEAFILEQLLLGEKVDHFETVRIRKDGRQVHVSVTISPIRDSGGRIIGASKVARDITPLKMEKERLAMALDAGGNALWDWDLKTGRVYRSARYYEVSGAPFEDDLKPFDFSLPSVHPQDRGRVQKSINDYIAGRSNVLEVEYRPVDQREGKDRWLMAIGRAVERDVAGNPIRIVGTVSDITRTKLVDVELRNREQRLSRVIDGSSQGYWDWNIQTNDFQVSARWETMLGYQPGEMRVTPDQWSNLVHPDDFPRVWSAVENHLSGKSDFLEEEMRCLTKSGHWHWILTRGRVVERDALGKPAMMSGTHTDISDRKDLELSQREALTVFSNSYEGIMVVGANRLITRVNPAFTRITGYTPEEVQGKSPALLASGRQDKNFYRALWSTLSETGSWSGEIWNRRKNGEIFAQILAISTVTDAQGKVQHYIGIFSDISQIKAHEEELDRVAHYDPLTGVPNRRLLVDRLAQAIARTNRTKDFLAVCYLDLDGFKAVNDHWGHATGDRLLVAVTESLRGVLRTEDTLARLGGDEFVILLSNIQSPEECSQIMARILSSVGQPVNIEGHTITISASIGVSLYPQDDVDADTLIRHADQAMYLAKDSGKNRFHLFDPVSDRMAQEHRQLVERLGIAIERDEFRLYYQPKVALKSGEIVGVEALIRWQHPELGLRNPGEFLPHLQGTQLERPLGVWVMRKALQQCEMWRAQGWQLRVSVNVSAKHILSDDFLGDLTEALELHPNVPPGDLELEVLESTAIDDMARAAHVLNECRRLGVHLALDDFGTGYSSLTYLRKLPFDVLKIDQSFVRDMLKDPEDRGIVEGVIRLAAAFDRSVIAEGVETMEHGAALLTLGCNFAQGYGIARPMPPEKFVDWASGWISEKSWLQMTV